MSERPSTDRSSWPSPCPTTPSLFLATASEENAEKTVLGSVPLAKVEPAVSPRDAIKLDRALRGRSTFHCWGMTEDSRRIYDQMRPGDFVLISVSETGEFTYLARVLTKLESMKLGRMLWSGTEGASRDLIYVIDDVQRVSVDKEKLAKVLGYSSVSGSAAGRAGGSGSPRAAGAAVWECGGVVVGFVRGRLSGPWIPLYCHDCYRRRMWGGKERGRTGQKQRRTSSLRTRPEVSPAPHLTGGPGTGLPIRGCCEGVGRLGPRHLHRSSHLHRTRPRSNEIRLLTAVHDGACLSQIEGCETWRS